MHVSKNVKFASVLCAVIVGLMKTEFAVLQCHYFNPKLQRQKKATYPVHCCSVSSDFYFCLLKVTLSNCKYEQFVSFLFPCLLALFHRMFNLW